MNKKRILVLLSTYNGEKYLSEQLESILNQIGVELHILIRDDGSADSTSSIIKDFARKDSRISYYKGSNIGFALSFTELLKKAYELKEKYDYFAFSDQDDVWLNNKLHRAISLLDGQDNTQPITYCSNTQLVDANLHPIKLAWNYSTADLTKERCLVQSFATGCTMVFNHKAIELYVTHLPKEIKVHDYLIYQICTFFGKVVYDNSSFILYRQHGSNQIGRPSTSTRIKKWFSKSLKRNVTERQNYYFLSAFQDLLSDSDKNLISKAAFYRANLKNRLSLLFSSKITYANSVERNITLKIKIILGIL